MRAAAAAAGAVALAGLTVGCTVPAGGVVGLTADSSGRPVAVVVMCEGHVDGLTVYSGRTTLGTWDSPAPVTDTAEVALTGPDLAWRAARPLTDVPSTWSISVYGWSDDDSWSARGPSFTTATLGTLTTTAVVYESPDGDLLTAPRESFREQACRDL